MNMLAGFKHRGAIGITADSFELFCKKLLNSDTYTNLPRKMLQRVFIRIEEEG
jgi:hypothetical protein